MSRSRWSPFVYALVAGAAAWLGWRFLPREWLQACRGDAEDARLARRPRPARPAAPPAGAETAADPVRAAAEPGATQADDPARCAGLTRSRTRCSREVEPGSLYCWQHGKG